MLERSRSGTEDHAVTALADAEIPTRSRRRKKMLLPEPRPPRFFVNPAARTLCGEKSKTHWRAEARHSLQAEIGMAFVVPVQVGAGKDAGPTRQPRTKRGEAKAILFQLRQSTT
mmetsp:Transcript_18954/g.47356  ORF Transcript_18954/g.47356 Transcript_18954/m.47356 type:complete len:114 (+) Transcript_18954:1064-1405(+)